MAENQELHINNASIFSWLALITLEYLVIRRQNFTSFQNYMKMVEYNVNDWEIEKQIETIQKCQIKFVLHQWRP